MQIRHRRCGGRKSLKNQQIHNICLFDFLFVMWQMIYCLWLPAKPILEDKFGNNQERLANSAREIQEAHLVIVLNYNLSPFLYNLLFLFRIIWIVNNTISNIVIVSGFSSDKIVNFNLIHHLLQHARGYKWFIRAVVRGSPLSDH